MSLWDFAVTFYARPGVEADLLALQDQGTDVCLFLCAAWLDNRAVAYHHTRMETLRSLAGDWQRRVVTPLRDLRIGWRERANDDSALATLRTRLKQLEQDSERVLLDRLEARAASWPTNEAYDQQWIRAVQPRLDTLGQHALERLAAQLSRSS